MMLAEATAARTLRPTPTPTPTPEAAPVVLEARGLSKRFGDVAAADDVHFAVGAGVHALLGENGAGKSTLVKLLYGYHQPDAGEIFLDGRRVTIDSPADARRLGIGLVFQQFTLIPALSVTENIALSLPDLPRIVDHDAIARRIRETSQRYGMAIDPAGRVGTLSLPEQQRVEILRVLLAGSRILIFDEPTSALPAQEAEALFDVFRRLRQDGYPIVFITHKLRDVLELADVVTVMRRGAVVGSRPIAEVDEKRLVQMMFGDAPATVRRSGPLTQEHAPVVLALEHVSARGEGRPLVDLDLSIHAGEIVGVAGVAGNGQCELADAIVGLSRITAGRRLLFGETATHWSVRRIREARVGFVPENAREEELIWSMTLEENVALGSPRRFSRAGGFSLDRRALRKEFSEKLVGLGLNLPDSKRRVGVLSGGNAQRFAVARELARDPQLLVAMYPTRGLDVPTAAAVQQLLLDARARGCAILLISQDLNELLALSDRLLVLRDARIVGEVDPRSADEYEIGRRMTGSEG